MTKSLLVAFLLLSAFTIRTQTRQVTTINTGTCNAYVVREIPMRSSGLTCTYKFGKPDFKKKDDHSMDIPAEN